jgi:hypothetical protein
VETAWALFLVLSDARDWSSLDRYAWWTDAEPEGAASSEAVSTWCGA